MCSLQALPEKLEESDPFSLFGTVSRNLQLEGSNVQWGFADICDLLLQWDHTACLIILKFLHNFFAER
ncbi:hypothetical protein AB3S75_039915 [Citrus x aurantiifolia]